MTVNWDQNAIRKLTEDASKKAMEMAQRAASGARCAEHQRPPKITGRDTRTGEFAIEACCEKGKQAALDAIARKFR